MAPMDGPDAGLILWQDAPVGRLSRGDALLRPKVRVIASDYLDAQGRERVKRSLETWIAGHLDALFRDLLALDRAEVSGAAKGLVFQLREAYGSLPRQRLDEQLTLIGRDDRRALRALGIRIGRETVYLPSLVKPAQATMRGFLWALADGCQPVAPPPPGRVSVAADRHLPAAYWEQVGFRRFGGLALRIDMVERVASVAWDMAKAAGRAGFEISADLLSLAGCGAEEMQQILKGLGFRAKEVEGVMRFRPSGHAPAKPSAPKDGKGKQGAKQKGRARTKAQPAPVKVDPHSPFAKLKDLMSS